MNIPIGSWVYAGLLVAALLAVCVAVIISLRDPVHAAPRTVSRHVWCPFYERAAVVEFAERIGTGTVFRSVRRCPLRREGEHCGGLCSLQLTAHPAH